MSSKWHNIDIIDESKKQSGENENRQTEGVTLYSLEDERLGLVLADCPPFDGIAHSKPQTSDSITTSQLTDFQCLLGIVSQFATVVTIHKCQALLLRHDHQRKDVTTATVVVTLSFPQLMVEPQSRLGIRGARDAHSAKRNIVLSKGKNVKLLHPAIQAILSSIQSNWEVLDQTMGLLLEESVQETDQHNIQGENPPRRKQQERRIIFPAQLSLDELYLRMESSQKSRNFAQQWQSKHIVSGTNDCPLIRYIPREILVDRIAPFLRASSVDALRSTCKYMQSTLSTVVPGLKLRLYRHQVNSLAWMRERECQQLTEDLCLKATTTNSSYQLSDACESDLHRGVSGGQSTLLKTRDGTFRCRVSQTLGREMSVTPRLNRLVARGGILGKMFFNEFY